jgi:hypothetical protein
MQVREEAAPSSGATQYGSVAGRAATQVQSSRAAEIRASEAEDQQLDVPAYLRRNDLS